MNPTRLLSCAVALATLLVGAQAAGQVAASAVPEQSRHGTDDSSSYYVVNLAPPGFILNQAINAGGQATFTYDDGSAYRAYFYDGGTVRKLGALGGLTSSAGGLNDSGQVTGTAQHDDGVNYAWIWSARSGMAELRTPSARQAASGTAINQHGEVTGASFFPDRTGAYRWTSKRNMEQLQGNSLAGTGGNYINDAGTIVGSTFPDQFSSGTFIWCRETGMLDIGSLGGRYTNARGLSADGLITGAAELPSHLNHAFVYSRHTGIQDIGTAGGAESIGRAMSASGHAVGSILYPDFTIGAYRAFSWTRAGGMVDIGTLGGPHADAVGVNNKGQVVGWSGNSAGTRVAMLWSARQGMVDLNGRLDGAPSGLVLDAALAISDSGAVLASSNAGLVLLKPGRRPHNHHALGPLTAPLLGTVGVPVNVSFSVAGADQAGERKLSWAWGDGSAASRASLYAGAGGGTGGGAGGGSSRASGTHTYLQPGIHTVTAIVETGAGATMTLSRRIVVYQPSRSFIGGQGEFMSTLPSDRQGMREAAPASFSLFAPPADPSAAEDTRGKLHFQLGTLKFDSDTLIRRGNTRAAGAQQARFEGSGKINGKGDVRFSLVIAAGVASVAGVADTPVAPGRFGLRLWHPDPVSKAEVVDYDNLGTGIDAARAGVAGNIAVVEAANTEAANTVAAPTASASTPLTAGPAVITQGAIVMME